MEINKTKYFHHKKSINRLHKKVPVITRASIADDCLFPFFLGHGRHVRMSPRTGWTSPAATSGLTGGGNSPQAWQTLLSSDTSSTLAASTAAMTTPIHGKDIFTLE